ncbi:MAG: Fur family transcriptional regulator [Candidatus Jordarchaeaceae archaeon]
MSSLQEFIDYLRSKGYKVTPQRLEIFKIIKSMKNHPTVYMIYQEVKKKNPTISPATVYKTLEVLERIGEIQAVCQIDGKTVYDTTLNPHINIHCLKCHKIEDVESDLVEKLVKDVQEKSGVRIISQSINFFGYCSKCKDKK